MLRIARVIVPLALAAAPLATTSAHADIINNCYGHDVQVRVKYVGCIGVDYPPLPPSGGVQHG